MSSQEDRYEGHDTLADHEDRDRVTDEHASVFDRDHSADGETTVDGEPVPAKDDSDSGLPDADRPFGFGHLTSSDPVNKDASSEDSPVGSVGSSVDSSVDSPVDSPVEDSSIQDVESKDVESKDVESKDVESTDVESTDVESTDVDASDVESKDVDDKDFDEDDTAKPVAETPISSSETLTDTPVVVAGSGVTSESKPEDVVAPVGATTVVPTESTPAASSSASAEWLELQGTFVDDPVAAVREAGSRVEQALAELRRKVESGSTEDLRTAFRRYRDLHATLR